MKGTALPLCLLAAIAGSGCVPPASPASARAPGTGECGASRVQDYRGATASVEVRAAIAGKSGARAIRWIGPDDAVTMDYSPDRLNVELDASGRIRTLRCG